MPLISWRRKSTACKLLALQMVSVVPLQVSRAVMNASNFHRVSVSGGKVTRSGPKALLLLCVVSSSASATPLVDTAFTGEQSADGSAVTGFYQYDMSTAILDSYSNSNGSVSAEYTFQAADNFFFAKRAD